MNKSVAVFCPFRQGNVSQCIAGNLRSWPDQGRESYQFFCFLALKVSFFLGPFFVYWCLWLLYPWLGDKITMSTSLSRLFWFNMNWICVLAQAACVRHACLRAPCVAWPLLLSSFSLSFSLFLSSFFSVFCFWPTSGNHPCAKICFPQYFGITRRYMQKKK